MAGYYETSVSPAVPCKGESRRGLALSIEVVKIVLAGKDYKIHGV